MHRLFHRLVANPISLSFCIAASALLGGCGGAASPDSGTAASSGSTPTSMASDSTNKGETAGTVTASAADTPEVAASAGVPLVETPMSSAALAAQTAADMKRINDALAATQATEAASESSTNTPMATAASVMVPVVYSPPAASSPAAVSAPTSVPVMVPVVVPVLAPVVAPAPVVTTPVAVPPVTVAVAVPPVAVTAPPVAVAAPPVTVPVPVTPVSTPPVTVSPPVSAPSPVASAPPVAGTLLWSDAATWNGAGPPGNADVVIPAGKTVVLDVSPIVVGKLQVAGTLKFADKDIQLFAASINVTGTMSIGSAAQPYVNKATITLTGAPAAVNDGVARGLVVNGGTLNLYGMAPSPAWTRLNDHAAAGTTALTLADSVNWRAGDTVVVGPTDYYGINPTERFTVAGASGTRVDTNLPLAKFRWGKLQYMTSQGLSLTQDGSYVPPATPAPTVLDERAAVANLSRNIVIQGSDDSAWRNSGFGAHLMVMNLASRVVVDGVEFRRVGQAGVTGRYPIHFHMLSYGTDGTMLGDASTIAVRNSSIWNSSNRCLVLHGTNGVTVQNNVCQNIMGHAFFLEDNVERRNVFRNNLALTVHNQPAATRLKVNEGDVGSGGASGFWITNPDNELTGNVGAEADGNGIWMAFPVYPHGLSTKVPIHPAYLLHGAFENNAANSNRKPGIQMQQDPCDEAGNICLTLYTPTSDDGGHENLNGNGYDTSYRRQVELKRSSVWKNGDGAYRNRVNFTLYSEWITADNPSVQMAGAANGQIKRSLFIGFSLNNANPLPSFNNVWPSALATYAQRVNDQDNVIYNFQYKDGVPSGMFDMEDYYLKPVIKATVRNTNNRLMQSSPGYRVLPPNLWSTPFADNNNYTLASAIWDPYGLTGGPNNNFWVYDVPFLTTGANCVQVPPAGKNGKSCDGQYYGVDGFVTDFSTDQYMPKMAIDVTRQDSTGTDIGHWKVADGNTSRTLPNMRHFSAHTGGTYVLRMPGSPLPKMVQMVVTNGYRSSDTFMFGMAFDGARTINTGYLVAGAAQGPQTARNWTDPRLLASKRTFRAAGSLAEVQAGDGTLMWQDRANNLVWIKYIGNLPYVQGYAANTDDDLYRPFALVLDSR